MDLHSSSPLGRLRSSGFIVMLLLGAAVLVVLFIGCFGAGHTLFSNDGPVGTQVQRCMRMPDLLTGSWKDLNSIGQSLAAWPSITYGLLWLLGPIGYSKFYALIGLLILGLGAWYYFRQLKLAPLACVLGGLAAMLNSLYFSTACWGVVAHPIAIGMCFLALGFLTDTTCPRHWIRVGLAGIAVGVAVADGADMGGILSIFVACCIIWQALVAEGRPATNLPQGIARVAVVAILAGVFAAQAIVVLFGTQVQGAGGASQDKHSREHWNFLTQWSLPKREALSLAVPGLFGYRMDTPLGLSESMQASYSGGQYWGAAGRDPDFDHYFKVLDGGTLEPGDTLVLTFPGSQTFNTTQQVHNDGKIVLTTIGELKAAGLTTNELAQAVLKAYGPQLLDKQVNLSLQRPSGFMRYSGGGPYVGVLVLLIGVWAAAQAMRKRDSVFTLEQRKLLWFWIISAVAALLLAFGRFAPFYWFLAQLPYFSNVRNPAKFLHIVCFALIVLFAHGVHALSRRKLLSETVVPGTKGTVTPPVIRPSAFDKRWIRGCIVAFAVALVGWLVYAHYRPAVEAYLQTVDFDEASARLIAGFSIRQVAIFVVVFALGVGLFTMILGGRFTGPKAKIGAVLLGAFLVVDLGLANRPWILFVDYENENEVSSSDPEKSSNPVIEFLRQQPYEHRVSLAPYNLGPFSSLYSGLWMQRQFQYFNIQCADIVQMPRASEDFIAYQSAFVPNGTPAGIFRIARKWQLTNTRYLFGPAGAINDLNQNFDPAQRRFRILTRFNLAYKPGIAQPRGEMKEITAIIDTNGPLAVIENGAALPRAKLYTQWQVNTNLATTLNQLVNPSFEPEQTVFVADSIPASTATTNSPAGQVNFVSYAPKELVFKAEAPASSVLLLNDRFDPDWKVFVDGKQQPLLRCNFIMRGVQVPPGTHQVEFRYKPPTHWLYVSLVGVFAGFVLVGCLLFVKDPEPQSVPGKPVEVPARVKA
jgi:hypothetical protein